MSSGPACPELAERAQVWLPATFTDPKGLRDPDASEPTWRSPSGPCSRIDFVMLPQAWRHGDFQPKVMYDLAMPREHDDHWPACVASRLLRHGPPTAGPTCRPPREPAELDDLARYALDFTWHSICNVPWSVNAHDHTRFLFDHVSSCLPVLASRHPRRKRAFMSDSALGLVGFCRVLKRHLGFLDREGRLFHLRALFAALHFVRNSQAPRSYFTSLGWTFRDLQVSKGSRLSVSGA